MCGRYTLVTYHDQLVEEFDLLDAPGLPPRFNIAPTQMVPVVRVPAGQAQRQLDMVRWGLIPRWAKDPAVGNRMINARSEEAAVKPAFHSALRWQRCLVPCSGFYEWKALNDKPARGKKKQKQPYYICRRDEGLFAFAGLWERWESPAVGTIESCTILTTEPNELVRPLHDRMPVIVGHADYGLWLDPAVREVEALEPLFRPFPTDDLVIHPVSTRVNNASFDDPSCIEAAT